MYLLVTWFVTPSPSDTAQDLSYNTPLLSGLASPGGMNLGLNDQADNNMQQTVQ